MGKARARSNFPVTEYTADSPGSSLRGGPCRESDEPVNGHRPEILPRFGGECMPEEPPRRAAGRFFPVSAVRVKNRIPLFRNML